jgi:hypothetical protein
MLRTQNEGYGFTGTVTLQGHDLRAAAVLFNAMGLRLQALQPGLDDAVVVEHLDSRMGRHLADWVGGDFAGDPDTQAGADSKGFFTAIQSGRLDQKLQTHLKSAFKRRRANGGSMTTEELIRVANEHPTLRAKLAPVIRHRLAAGGVPVHQAEMREVYYGVGDGVSGLHSYLREHRRILQSENREGATALANAHRELNTALVQLKKALDHYYPNWD